MITKNNNFRAMCWEKTPNSQCLKIKKSLNQHCERSELLLHFLWIKDKMTKMVDFGEFSKTWNLWSSSVTRPDNCQNSNATYWVIYKQCGCCWEKKNSNWFIVRWVGSVYFAFDYKSASGLSPFHLSLSKLWKEDMQRCLKITKKVSFNF